VSRPAAVWTVAALLWALFAVWYTNLAGPLTADEVESYVGLMRENGRSAAEIARIRQFLDSDTGDDFVMVNVIQMREKPLRREGIEPGESSEEVLGRYMAYMWPALLRRACHPVLAGDAVAQALEVWGVSKARDWTMAGMMRYRSRRDLMEIASAPEFNGPHEFKLAAMEKTIAFPIEANLLIGDLRGLLGLLLFSLAAMLHLALGERRSGGSRIAD
jgi:hypothetical protein